MQIGGAYGHELPMATQLDDTRKLFAQPSLQHYTLMNNCSSDNAITRGCRLD